MGLGLPKWKYEDEKLIINPAEVGFGDEELFQPLFSGPFVKYKLPEKCGEKSANNQKLVVIPATALFQGAF
jgi:hypothetical protein